MPNTDDPQNDAESLLFDAIINKNLDEVKRIVKNHPKINLDCLDKDELSPLQHACHSGNLELAIFLLDHGAGVDFTGRKDSYTPLMFAAISARADIVRLLLERGVDITAENCVHRTAAQMAAFVGQFKVVSMINSWVPYATSVKPYTSCRELEDKPRISSDELGHLLHRYIVYPSLHPVKLLLFIKENLGLVEFSKEFIYVLENLSSKAIKHPSNEESLSLKYYYFSYLIEYCSKTYKLRQQDKTQQTNLQFDAELCDRCIEIIIRRLIKRENPKDPKPCTLHLDQFITECMMKFPYTQLSIFKTMTYALTQRNVGDLTAYAILTQSLDGPRMFGQKPDEICAVCGEMDKNKKCSKCKSVYYCGRSCQRADWFLHKKVCKD